MVQYVNSLVNTVWDPVLSGFRRENPWPAMIAASFVATVILLLVMRSVARPEAMARSKKKLIARVMELHLFRHDLSVSLTACGRIVSANLAYLRHLLLPTLLAVVPGVLILIQLNCWFSRKPLQIGEAAIVEVQFGEGEFPGSRLPAITTSDSLRIDSPPLRIPALRQVNWRIRPETLQDGWIDVELNGRIIRKQVSVGSRLAKVSEARVQAAGWELLLNPVEQPIEISSEIVAVRIRYPPRKMYLGLREIHWLLAFLVLTMLFGVILKGPLNVPL